MDYLVEKGVSADRLVAIGMSDSEPKILNTDVNGLSAGVLSKDYINSLKSNRLKEAAHQMNRTSAGIHSFHASKKNVFLFQ